MRLLERTALLLLVGVLSLAGACTDIEPPSEEGVMKVFTSRDPVTGLEPAAPDNVPILAIQELEDWHELCDQCHRGPEYSSYSILNWGHRESCVADVSCHDCHRELLHETMMRGDKSNCFDCHLNRNLKFVCNNCHGDGCWDNSINHDDAFVDTHGEFNEWQGLDCSVCHASSRWCLDCHGIEMPHPGDVLEAHPSLVKGHPEVCNKCHGEESCDSCHRERGVTPDLEEFLRSQLDLVY